MEFNKKLQCVKRSLGSAATEKYILIEIYKYNDIMFCVCSSTCSMHTFYVLYIMMII